MIADHLASPAVAGFSVSKIKGQAPHQLVVDGRLEECRVGRARTLGRGLRFGRADRAVVPAGDWVKTDVRDARHLARLLHLGEITAVTVPSVEQEAARDLIRAREDVRADLTAARHRLSKLLLRQGIVYYGGAAWTGGHDRWLRVQRQRPLFDMAGLGTAFDVA